MKALFFYITHNKTNSEKFCSSEGFCRVVGPQNTLLLEYVLVWVRKQIRAFMLDFRAISYFSTRGSHLLSFGAQMGLL